MDLYDRYDNLPPWCKFLLFLALALAVVGLISLPFAKIYVNYLFWQSFLGL